MSHFRQESFHGAFRATMVAWIENEKKRRWGEKTPHNILFWRDIAKNIPASKFIHIVRDGRDVALSWKKVRFGPEHFYKLANLWRSYIREVEKMKSILKSSRVLEVKYEKILAKPKVEIKNMCRFLGEEFSSNMLKFYNKKEKYPTDKRNEKNLSRPLLRSNMNKWKTQVGSRNLRIFEAVAGEMLKRYGYELSQQDPSISQREIWQIKYVEHPVTRLFGMLKDVQGMREATRSLPLYLRLAAECYLGIKL